MTSLSGIMYNTEVTVARTAEAVSFDQEQGTIE